MRLVLNFLNALRKAGFEFSKKGTQSGNLAGGRGITIGEDEELDENDGKDAPAEWRWVNRARLQVEKPSPEPRFLWHNIKRALLISGGQGKPGGFEDELKERDRDCSRLVDILEAQRFVSQVFAAMDVPKQAASEMADVLIAADYMGHRSMGIHRLPSIAADLLNGTVVGKASPTILSELEAVALVDGHNGPGPVVANFCMDLAIQKAREVGIGWVSARRSNCIGMASWYACQALEQRMIGLCMTNAAPTLVPCGGIQAILGENPIACAASGAQEQFLADFGMSAISLEELKLSYCNGVSNKVPESVALDRDGQETTCAAEALRAKRIKAFKPEYKGFGLAAMVDILSGVMTGARYANLIQRRGVYSPENEPADLGQVYVAIDPMRFCSDFEDRLLDFHRVLREVAPSKHGKPPLVPGDKEMQHMKQVDEQGGLTMSPCTLCVLDELANQFCLAPLKMKGEAPIGSFRQGRPNHVQSLRVA